MLNPYISCGIYAAEFVIFYIFYSRIGQKRFSSYISFFIGLMLFEVGSLLNLWFENNVGINTLASITIKILFSLIFFQLRPIIAVCYAILMDALNFALELMSIFLFSAVIGQPFSAYSNNLSLFFMTALTNKLLLFLTCLVLSNMTNKKDITGSIPGSLFFYPVSATVCMIIFWYIGASSDDTVCYLLMILSVIIFCSTTLLFITYQHQIEANMELIRLRNEVSRVENEKAYYDILEQQNQNLMIYAHDTKKHLVAIESLSTDPEIHNYVKQLTTQLKTYSQNCHSGNKLLDVIINKYVLDAHAKGLHFSYDVKLCNLNSLEDFDLVAILSNLMDNAFTAAHNSDEKTVSLETVVSNGYSVLIITNSCDQAPHTNGCQLITTKKNKEFHGLGLTSVSKSLSKYHGDFQWDYDAIHHLFIMTAMIGEADPCKA